MSQAKKRPFFIHNYRPKANNPVEDELAQDMLLGIQLYYLHTHIYNGRAEWLSNLPKSNVCDTGQNYFMEF